MKKLQKKVQGFKTKQKGEITVFLSLVFLLLLTLVGALVESASIRLSRNNIRADLDLAMESVFAEYHKELFSVYHIFALDAGYGTDNFSYENVLRRLDYYGGDETENTLTETELLTDRSGAEFYRQAMMYVVDRYGMGSMVGEKDSNNWAGQEKNGEEYEKEQEDVWDAITGKLSEAGETLPESENPLSLLTEWKQTSLLTLLIGDGTSLSNRSIPVDTLPTHRTLREGKGTKKESGDEKGAAGKLLFGQYVLEHFSDFTEQSQEGKMWYETEYLLSGKSSERENLEAVFGKILLLRLPVNYAYLLTDEVKKAEAETMAAGLCTLLTVPGITELVKQAILIAWAYGESVMDLRVVTAGEKVAAIKTKDTWSLSLANLANLGGTGKGAESGLSYQDFLRMLLFLEKKEVLSMRALDLMEYELSLPMDLLVTEIRMESICSLRRGIECKFRVGFAYQ